MSQAKSWMQIGLKKLSMCQRAQFVKQKVVITEGIICVSVEDDIFTQNYKLEMLVMKWWKQASHFAALPYLRNFLGCKFEWSYLERVCQYGQICQYKSCMLKLT